MTNPFSYSTLFVLDKAHFNECFSNSVVVEHSLKAYSKAMVLFLMGVLLAWFTEINDYAAYFLVALGIIDALGTYYRQPWWVTRQMWSRAANSEVKLTLDETGIYSDSSYFKTTILWQDIDDIKSTKDGLIVVHEKGRSYISNNCLSDEAKAFLLSKFTVHTAP